MIPDDIAEVESKALWGSSGSQRVMKRDISGTKSSLQLPLLSLIVALAGITYDIVGFIEV